MTPLVVVYDACVLFPAPLRDLLLRLTLSGLFQARWSEKILDEVFSSLVEARPDLDPVRLAVTRRKMCEAVPDSLVKGYENLLPAVELPDAEDRHVVAAAIRCRAQVIVTNNVKDFPASSLDAYGIEAQAADDFVLSMIDLAPSRVADVVKQQAADLKKPLCTTDELVEKLARNGLVQSMAKLRIYL